jgi:penicillin G amidase
MDQAGEGRRVSARLEPADVRGRSRPGDRKHALDRLEHARHASERQRRSEEGDGFAVIRPIEATDQLDGIGRGIGVVELPVQPIEKRFQGLDNEYDSVMRRWLLKAFAAIVVLLAIALVAVYVLMRRSLPVVDGETRVRGISAPVEIVRDADAIPHIFAATKADALFGLGYVHAQDRLWQMEFQRRIGHGRLSEIFGAATIPQDRFLRTVGFGRAAKAAWAATPAWAQQQVNAYVAGVNAFISTHHGSALPPEFSLLRFEPDPWTGADVIAWVKMMAWDLSANYSFELLRADLKRAVGDQRAAALMPDYPLHGLSILTGGSTTEDSESNGGHGSAQKRAVTSVASDLHPSVLSRFSETLSQGTPAVRDFLLGAASAEALGSNNWVVDGTLTASGKPLLANDPHLGTRLPSTWYLAHVSAGDFEMIGATLPGTPAVALGRNRRIAWGATNVAADVEDLYRERLDEAGRSAEFRGAMEPITIIPEIVRVKGADDLHVNVRVTRHGPLVSDAINANPPARGPKPPALEPLAFRWTALDPDDSSLVAFLKLNEAGNWDQFTAALRDFVVPSQNFVYADVDGHIGYYAPGRIPIRASGDGAAPAEGWSGNAEWTGWVPFDELPHLYDPPTHAIVTANHRPAPPSYPHHLGLEWPEPYRAQRIWELLGSGGAGKAGGFSADDFARIQGDTVSLHARALVPVLLSHARSETEVDRRAVDMLRSWNFDAAGGSAQEAIFEAWFHQLAPAIAGDELGPAVLDSYKSRFTFITRFVTRTLGDKDSRWCDDVRTPKQESCDDTVTKALHEGVVDLTRRLGGDMSRWRWEAVHPAVFPHQGLDAVAPLRPLLSRSVPNGGDWSTVNVGPVAADTPFEQHSVPGYREIIDLSPANDSRFLDAVGESGHFLSPHYADFLADWHDVRHRKMRMDRADIERSALGHLRLVP